MVRWFFFGIVLALMPIGINALLIKVNESRLNWSTLLKEGELFFFAAFLAATSLGGLNSSRTDYPVAEVIILCGLLLILLIASVLFAVARYFKLNNIEPKRAGFFTRSSIVCATVAALLSLATLLLTGGAN